MNENDVGAGNWFFGKVLHMGANWQTTLSGVLSELSLVGTILAGIPTALAEAGVQVTPHGKLAATFLAIKIATGLWNSFAQKSKNVTGGSTMQTLSGNVASPKTQSLVDATLKATADSGEKITPEQKEIVKTL